MILAIVLLPVTGLAVLALREASLASDHRDDVSSIATSIDDLTARIRFTSAVSDEKHWSYATRSLDALDVPHELVVEMAGIDLWAEEATAVQRVDDLARSTGSTDLLEQIQAIRADRDLSALDLDAAYDAVEDAADARLAQAVERLDELPKTAEIAEALQILHYASGARDDLATQMASFFSLRF